MRAKRNTSAKRYEKLTRLNAMSDGLAVDAHALNVFLAAEAVAAAIVVAAGGLSQRAASVSETMEEARREAAGAER